LQVLVNGFYGGVFAKVDSDSVTHNGGAVEGLSDGDGFVFGWERAYDTTEGFQRGPCYDGGVVGDYVAEVLEGFRVEGFGVLQVCY